MKTGSNRIWLLAACAKGHVAKFGARKNYNKPNLRSRFYLIWHYLFQVTPTDLGQTYRPDLRSYLFALGLTGPELRSYDGAHDLTGPELRSYDGAHDLTGPELRSYDGAHDLT